MLIAAGGMLLAFGLLISPAQAQEEKAPPLPENGYCLLCHNTDSAHGAARLSGVHLNTLSTDEPVGCLSCHGEAAVFPHRPAVDLNLDAEACTACHTDSHEQVQSEQHARELIWGDFGAATCLDCHGAHEVVAAAELPCNTCHGAEIHNFSPDLIQGHQTSQACEDCHQGTVAEWQAGPHADQQLACETCHVAGDRLQGLRFGDTNSLCLNCHEDQRSNATHLQHAAQDCAGCHLYNNRSVPAHVRTGELSYSGHDNVVTVAACLDCHQAAVEVAAAAPQDQHPLLVTETRIIQLETGIEAEREEAANEAALRLAQSTVIGLALGVILALGFVRFRRYRSGLGILLLALLGGGMLWNQIPVQAQDPAPEAPESFIHQSHPEQTCQDCHESEDYGEAIPAPVCTDCHDQNMEEQPELAQSLGSLREAELQIHELEAEEKSVQAQGENMVAVRTMQGLILGLGLGGGLGLLVSYRRKNGG
jgi:hypothetical protein